MAAIRHNLQREVFKPSEERLYAVVNVTKAGKKKKASFLCAAGKGWMITPKTSTYFRPLPKIIIKPHWYYSMLLSLPNLRGTLLF